MCGLCMWGGGTILHTCLSWVSGRSPSRSMPTRKLAAAAGPYEVAASKPEAAAAAGAYRGRPVAADRRPEAAAGIQEGAEGEEPRGDGAEAAVPQPPLPAGSPAPRDLDPAPAPLLLLKPAAT